MLGFAFMTVGWRMHDACTFQTPFLWTSFLEVSFQKHMVLYRGDPNTSLETI